jgi:hypothetical protein
MPGRQTGAIAKYGHKSGLTTQYGSIAAHWIVRVNYATRIGTSIRRNSFPGTQASATGDNRQGVSIAFLVRFPFGSAICLYPNGLTQPSMDPRVEPAGGV